jgi:serine/threonine protein kinase
MLGKGSFGVVRADGSDGAIKQMRPSESARDCIPHTSIREVAALAALSGAPNVPTPISMEAHESGVVHVQMQRLYMTLMEEQERRPPALRRRSPQEVRRVLEDVGTALLHAHSRGIAHRDIKLENIMVDKRRCFYLIDWGLCCFRQRRAPRSDTARSCDRYTQDVGTPIYRSPEAATGEYDVFAADVWALAIVCIELFMGKHPFHTKLNDVLLQQIHLSFSRTDDSVSKIKNGPVFSVAAALKSIEIRDKPLASALRAMLNLEYNHRISIGPALSIIKSPTPPFHPQLPAPPLPAPGKIKPSAQIIRAHGWITELSIIWSIGERAHDIAQWCFASSLRKEPADEDISKHAASILVICSKALCSNSRLTSSAQRVCTEQHLTIRSSDRSISKEFSKLEAEMLCLMSGKIFFNGISEITKQQCHTQKLPEHTTSVASFFSNVAVIRCAALLSEQPHRIALSSIEIATHILSYGRHGSIPPHSEKLISYAKIEIETSGPILTFTKCHFSHQHLRFIQKIASSHDIIVVHITDQHDSDDSRSDDAFEPISPSSPKTT